MMSRPSLPCSPSSRSHPCLSGSSGDARPRRRRTRPWPDDSSCVVLSCSSASLSAVTLSRRAAGRDPTWGFADTSCHWCHCRVCQTARSRCRCAAAGVAAGRTTACRSSAPDSCTWRPVRPECPAASDPRCTRSTPPGRMSATHSWPRNRTRWPRTAALLSSRTGAAAACASGASSAGFSCPPATRPWLWRSASYEPASRRWPRNSTVPVRQTSRCRWSSRKTCNTRVRGGVILLSLLYYCCYYY